jgi:drug/metabolite transporter (DMT)-like permease
MTPPSDHLSRRRALGLVVIGGAAFSTSGPLAFYAQPAHPLVIVLGRVALSAILLLLAGGIGRITRKQLVGVVLGGFLLAAHFMLFVWGLWRTSLPAAVSLVSLEPLSVVLVAWLLQGLRPSRLEGIGVLIATGGAIVIARGAGSGSHRLDGDLMVLGAVVLYGLYLAVARSFRGDLPAHRYAALVYAAATVPSAIAAFATPDASFDLERHSWIAIVALALIPTLIGHTMVQAAARLVPPAIVALVSPGETVGGLIIGVTLLSAQPQPVELYGAAIVVVGATVAILGTRST